MRTEKPGQDRDRPLLLAALMLLLFVSPLKEWWGTGSTAWFLPYLLWLAVIVMAFLAYRRSPVDDG